MNTTLTVAIGLVATMPPPPVPGGDAAGDVWWRVLGILLVSLVTVAIFLFLFRPLTPSPAEGIDKEQREDEELTLLAAQLTSERGEDIAPVIPFRARGRASETGNGSDVSNATARLRRILGQSARGEPVDRPVRRRLGDRHHEAVPQPAGQSQDESAANAPLETERVDDRQARENEDEVTATTRGDIWGDLGDIGHLRPSEADRIGSASNNIGEAPQPPTIAGEIPTEHDLNRLGAAQQSSGKIVPFVPRPSRKLGEGGMATVSDSDQPDPGTPPASVRPITVDARTREAIEAVVRQLLFCANVGEVLQGFGLYTDDHLRRFMAESGMPEREFQALFAAVPPRQPDDWTRIEFINRIVRLDGGQISADVRYVDGHHPNGTERLTFVQDPETKRWLIDDIQAI